MDDADTQTNILQTYKASTRQANMYTKITDQQLTEWKKTLAQSGIAYKTDDEYRDSLQNLAGFFDILIQIDLKQKAEEQAPSEKGASSL